MINLLPPIKKENLFLEQVKKMAIVLGLVAVISLICFILILLSINFYILQEIVAQKSIFSDANTTDFSDTKNIVQKYNKIFPEVINFYSKDKYFSTILKNILEVEKPEGLFLSDISLSWGDGGIAYAKIVGTSNTRENLLIFKGNIEGDKMIKKSQFSSDSWIKEKNTNFNLTLEF